MNTLEAIIQRKSVRTYLEKEIEKEMLEQIAVAGNYAAGTPMAGNRYFSVITNKDLLSEIVSATKTVMQNSGMDMLVKLSSNPNFNPIYNAPAVIVVATDRQQASNMAAMARANAACAAENMLLAAADLGLGSCYVESPCLAFNNPSLRNKAGLPENCEVQAMVLLGYTEDIAPHTEKKADNIIYID